MESVIAPLLLGAAEEAIHGALDARIGRSWTTNLIVLLALLLFVGFSQPFSSKLKNRRKVPWPRRRFLANFQTGTTLAIGFLAAGFLGLIVGWAQDQGSQVFLIGLAGYVLYAGAMAFVRSLEWVANTKEVVTQVRCTVCREFGSLIDEQENRGQELSCELTPGCRGTMKPLMDGSSPEAAAVTASGQGAPESR